MAHSIFASLLYPAYYCVPAALQRSLPRPALTSRPALQNIRSFPAALHCSCAEIRTEQSGHRSPLRADSTAVQRGEEAGGYVRSWRVVWRARFGRVRCGVSGRRRSQTGPRGRWSRQCRHAVRNWAARPPSRPAGRTGIAARPAAPIPHGFQLAN